MLLMKGEEMSRVRSRIAMRMRDGDLKQKSFVSCVRGSMYAFKCPYRTLWFGKNTGWSG